MSTGTPSTPTQPGGPIHQVRPRSSGRGRLATLVAVVCGVIASLMTAFLVYASLVEDWAGHVGGERAAALFILGFVGLLTLLMWLIMALALAARRR